MALRGGETQIIKTWSGHATTGHFMPLGGRSIAASWLTFEGLQS